MTAALRLGATFFVLVSLFATPSMSVTPANFWTVVGGDVGSEAVQSLAIVPSNGDIVVTGNFHGTLDFGGGFPLVADNSQNATDIFLARFSRSGELRWAKHFGSNASEQGNAVVVDASGNIYLVGQFFGSFYMTGQYRNSNGQSDLFVTKFDGLGNDLWTNSYGGTSYDVATSVAVDGSGNIFVGGYFTLSADLGGGAITGSGNADAFVAKYSANGAWQWNQPVTGTGDEAVASLASDGTNVYVAGYFTVSASLSGFPALNTAGGQDIFMAKMGPTGTIQWVQRRGGTGHDQSIGIAADAAGNIAVTGAFHDSVNFGGSTLVSAGGFDGFLARYNTSGVHQWSLRFGTIADYEAGYAVTMNTSSKVFVTGSCATDVSGTPGTGGLDILMAKYSSLGVLAWSRVVGGLDSEVGDAIGVDTGDNIAIGGAFYGPANFGLGTLTANGGGGLFLARYGVAEPAITSVKDVGNDQGRQVRITFARSPLDDGTASQQQVTEYQAFRRVLPLPTTSMRGAAPQPVPSGSWEYVASVPASNQTTYRMLAPTLADSTVALGMYRSKYYIRAATEHASLFYDSPVDSGYSLDNLAPGVPVNFAYVAGNLSWNKSSAEDFDYFSVYGSNSNSFGAATLIDYTVAPALDVTASNYSYYWVTATDFSGNEGKPAKVNRSTGVGDTPPPHVLSVSAYPNPFNPETTVRYTLPSRGHVQIDIFDLRGEHVATLVDRDEDAGAYTVTWRGLDDAGGRVGSGVYFARMSAGGAACTYKLTLLK